MSRFLLAFMVGFSTTTNDSTRYCSADDQQQEELLLQHEQESTTTLEPLSAPITADEPTSIFSSNSVNNNRNENSLDGYAFDCGGLLIGFQKMDEIWCMNGSRIPCGSYQYDAPLQLLSGTSSLTGPFLAWDLQLQQQQQPPILVSFQSDLGVTCNAVSLDWPQYSTTHYMGLKCPVQNKKGMTYQDNHFSLGRSGDVALRSPVEFITTMATTTSDGGGAKMSNFASKLANTGRKRRRLVRDLYGIYQWFDQNNNTSTNTNIVMYFGPQQNQGVLILKGKLTTRGELFIHNYIPPGPCIHDGDSAIVNTTDLPKTLVPPTIKKEEEEMDQGPEMPSSSFSSGTMEGQKQHLIVLMMLVSTVSGALLSPY